MPSDEIFIGAPSSSSGNTYSPLMTVTRSPAMDVCDREAPVRQVQRTCARKVPAIDSWGGSHSIGGDTTPPSFEGRRCFLVATKKKWRVIGELLERKKK